MDGINVSLIGVNAEKGMNYQVQLPTYQESFIL
jgi:hypothetical protein